MSIIGRRDITRLSVWKYEGDICLSKHVFLYFASMTSEHDTMVHDCVALGGKRRHL